MASGMNPVEKTIVVVVAYCIAILAIVLLHVSGVLQWPVVVGGLAAPLILGACASRLRRSLLLAAFTAALGTPFVLSQGALVIAPMFAGYLLAAGAIGMLNQKRAARKERWRRARSIEDRHDREVFDCSMNVLHAPASLSLTLSGISSLRKEAGFMSYVVRIISRDSLKSPSICF